MKRVNEELIHEEHYKEIHEHVKNDPYANYLGIELTEFKAGEATASLEIKDHMVNAYNTVHGAIIYALADHAFSVACNAYGKTSLGISTTINFMESALPGDRLTAVAKEVKRTFRTGFYKIEIYHKNNQIASMEAISYRKDQYFIDL